MLTGISLNVVSFVGVIMLMGVVVNDAIVMIDRIGQFEAAGMNRYDTLVEGSKSRMRAIWMTTVTTVLALVPLALGIGKGSELMQPLGTVVIGGLTLATLVTLIIIPVMYSIIKRVKIPKKGEMHTENAPEPTSALPQEKNVDGRGTETVTEEEHKASETEAVAGGAEKGAEQIVTYENPTENPVKREETPLPPPVRLIITIKNKADKSPKKHIPLSGKIISEKDKN